jgi:hypothetical protein
LIGKPVADATGFNDEEKFWHFVNYSEGIKDFRRLIS